MTPDHQRVFLDDLAKRWRQDGDRILELALNGAVPLWIDFADVYLQKATAARQGKAPAKMRHDRVEVQPLPEALAQIQGRCDRMLIAAELPCLDVKGKPVTVTNSVGEEWGDTSMIGLKPTVLFARLDDVLRYERLNGIASPEHGRELPPADQVAGLPAASANRQDHPCYARELDIAVQCWHALYGEASTGAGFKKTAILDWIRQHHPDLTKTAGERIALVVAPSTNQPGSTKRAGHDQP